MTATPVTLARLAIAREITAADAERRWTAARRRDAARAGYHGPLTRAELAAQAARDARRRDPAAILVQG